MTLRQRIRFYQQLAVLARAGVPMRTSLQKLEKRVTGPEVAVLARQIEAGEPLGDAFTAAGFSPFECHLVAAGERSAQLETVFERLGEFWQRELHLFEALTRQLYYPIVLLHLTIFVGALLLLSQGIVAVIVSIVLNLALAYTIGFALYVLVRVSWRSEVAQRFWLFLPIIGNALATSYAYRWITALRLEFVAGVPIPDAVSDAWLASGYVGSARHAVEGERGLRSGEELSGLMKKWRQLPRDWIDFVETGEISGEFEAMFTNIETETARSWTLAQERMTEWLPKIFSFGVLVISAALIGYRIYQQTIEPIADVEKMLNNP